MKKIPINIKNVTKASEEILNHLQELNETIPLAEIMIAVCEAVSELSRLTDLQISGLCQESAKRSSENC